MGDAKQPVMDGYIRVSQVAGRSGERFHSPEEQRSRIEGWAQAHGVRIAAWHVDLDQSGGTMDRPGMNEAVRRAEEGVTGGVVVARLDRFARTVTGGLATIQRLHDRGARVVSVAEQIDPATPMGRAMLGLLLIMAEWQRDQANEALGAAQSRAVTAGRWPGKTPWGYTRLEDGTTVVDPDTAQHVKRIFELRADGVGWRSICAAMQDARVLTPTGRERWAMTSVTGIVRSEAPLGVFCGPRGVRVDGAWPAIVSRDLWERANAVRGRRDNDRVHHDRLFAGIARCAECRHTLKRTVAQTGFVSYGCVKTGCPRKGSIGASILDDFVGGMVDERLARVALDPSPAADDTDVTQLVTARDSAARDLEDWRDDLEIRGVLGDADWREGLIARARARDAADQALTAARSKRGLVGLPTLPDGVVPSLGMLPWEVRRRLVETMVHSVWMRRADARARGPAARRLAGERLLVVWADDPSPPELPTRQAGDMQPVEWPQP